jgi:hypothetical protein
MMKEMDGAVRYSALVVHLPSRPDHEEGLALAVTDGVEPEVQRAFCKADAPISSIFLRRLAVARWALRWVLSVISRSGSPASPASAATILLNTPIRLQRTKRL